MIRTFLLSCANLVYIDAGSAVCSGVALGALTTTPDPAHRPSTFALIDESGKRLYASCLSYMDAVPALLASRHEHLLGAKATCALCLLCRQPYLATAEQVKQGLRQL